MWCINLLSREGASDGRANRGWDFLPVLLHRRDIQRSWFHWTGEREGEKKFPWLQLTQFIGVQHWDKRWLGWNHTFRGCYSWRGEVKNKWKYCKIQMCLWRSGGDTAGKQLSALMQVPSSHLTVWTTKEELSRCQSRSPKHLPHFLEPGWSILIHIKL